MHPRLRLVHFAFLGVLLTTSLNSAKAAILAGGAFTDVIVSIDPLTGVQTPFATLPNVPNSGLGRVSGLTYDPVGDRVIASHRDAASIFVLDRHTGATVGSRQLGALPGGVAVDAAGNLYVATFGFTGDGSIEIFDPSLNPVSSIALGSGVFPTGLTFNQSNQLLVGTFFGPGILQVDPFASTPTVTTFATVAGPNLNQLAVDASGGVTVGTIASNDVLRFASNGTAAGAITIDDAILPQPMTLGYASPDVTNPAAIIFDENGDLLIGALGRTNPTRSDDFNQNNGGLFRFSASGVLLDTLGTDIGPISALTILPAAIPEPSSLLALVGLTAAAAWQRRRRAVRQGGN